VLGAASSALRQPWKRRQQPRERDRAVLHRSRV